VQSTCLYQGDFLKYFWAHSDPPAPIEVKFLYSQADPRARQPCQVWHESVQRVAPAGRKTWFWDCE